MSKWEKIKYNKWPTLMHLQKWHQSKSMQVKYYNRVLTNSLICARKRFNANKTNLEDYRVELLNRWNQSIICSKIKIWRLKTSISCKSTNLVQISMIAKIMGSIQVISWILTIKTVMKKFSCGLIKKGIIIHPFRTKRWKLLSVDLWDLTTKSHC